MQDSSKFKFESQKIAALGDFFAKFDVEGELSEKYIIFLGLLK